MAVTHLEISYPNFVLGAIIDPEEANQNNFEFVEKINTTIELTNTNQIDIAELFSVKEDKTVVAALESRFQTHRTSTDHDGRYFTQTQLNDKFAASNQQLTIHKSSSDHDGRYYTREELTPWLRGGDTTIREDVFVIKSINLAEGTFVYTHKGNDLNGTLGNNGEQIFTLMGGTYEPETNRIEATIDDALRRSVASGGLIEIDKYTIALTTPVLVGTEVTFKYYERVGMTAEYTIKMSLTKPPMNNGKNMWFEVIQ